MRVINVAVGVVFLTATHSVWAQQTTALPLRQLEKDMLARISERATALGGFRFDSSEFDLRLPLRGEPEEIFGPTTHSNDALAVGSARMESLDSNGSRNATFRNARYDLRLEDRKGNCLIVHQPGTSDSKLVPGRRTSEQCQPLYR